MKRKVSFVEFFSTLGMGLWQTLCWVCKVFNPKYKTAFWRVIWAVIALCLLAITSIITYEYVQKKRNWYERNEQKEYLSENAYLVKEYYGDAKYICNTKTGKKVNDIDWFYFPDNKDELAVYSQKGKRGYYNWKTGEVAIEPKYSKAWIFGDKLAAVCKGDSLFFIDKNGKEYFRDYNLYYTSLRFISDYVFHDGFCVVVNRYNRFGLLRTDGSWALEMDYDRIEWIAEERIWKVEKDDYKLLMDKDKTVLFDGIFDYLEFVDRDHIYAAEPEGLICRYNLEGEILDTGIITNAQLMTYTTDEMTRRVDDDGDVYYFQHEEYATCMSYRFQYEKYGLMSKTGKIITPAVYSNIVALGKDLYLCDIDYEHSVLLNSRGEKIVQELKK